MRSEPKVNTLQVVLRKSADHEAHFSLGSAKMDNIIDRDKMEECEK
jgi:hypothetical protein